MTDRKDKQIGEGSYEATRAFKASSRRFLDEHGKEVDDLAHAAEDALDGEEAGELEAAEAEGRSHAKK